MNIGAAITGMRRRFLIFAAIGEGVGMGVGMGAEAPSLRRRGYGPARRGATAQRSGYNGRSYGGTEPEAFLCAR
ncbi:MAG: hypothetical protein Kow00133_04710 [Amphiplicatus sp.]